MLAAVLPRAGAAQEPHAYVGGGVTISPWKPTDVVGSASLSFDNVPGADPWAPGLAVEAGAFAGRHVSLGVEFGLPARRDLVQTHGYFDPFSKVSRYRETAYVGLLRVRLAPGTIGIDLVGGGDL